MGIEKKQDLGYVPFDRGTDGLPLYRLTEDDVTKFTFGIGKSDVASSFKFQEDIIGPTAEQLKPGQSYKITNLEKLLRKPESLQDDNAKVKRYIDSIAKIREFPPVSWFNAFSIIQLAASINDNLEKLLREFSLRTEDHLKLVEQLLYLRNEIERRTKSDYKIFTREYAAQDKDVLSYYPFYNYEKWKLITDNKKGIEAGKVLLWELIAVPNPTDRINEDEFQKKIIELDNELKLIDATLLTIPKSNTPVINKSKANLQLLSFKQVNKQTGATWKPALQSEDAKLWNWTHFILYHSVFTVVLDKNGEPFDFFGKFDYPIIVPAPKFTLKRHLQPEGLYINTPGPNNYMINGGEVKKIILGGITGFEKFGYGFSWEDASHETFQSELNQVSDVIFCAIVTKSVFQPKEYSYYDFVSISLALIKSAIPFTIREVSQRLKSMAENLEEIAMDIFTMIITEVIIARIREYINTKVAPKFVPLINLGFLLLDKITEDDSEVIRQRNAIACMVMAVKGATPDDMTISAKVLSKILADEFIDEIINKLVSLGVNFTSKAISGSSKPSPQGGGLDPVAPIDSNDAPVVSHTSPIQASDIDLQVKAPQVNIAGRTHDLDATSQQLAEAKRMISLANRATPPIDEPDHGKPVAGGTKIETTPLTSDGSVLRRTGGDKTMTTSADDQAAKISHAGEDNDATDVEISRMELEKRGTGDGIDTTDEESPAGLIPAPEQTRDNKPLTAQPKFKPVDKTWDPRATKHRGIVPGGPMRTSNEFHHLIPQTLIKNHPEIKALLESRGINIDDFTVKITWGIHSATHSTLYNNYWSTFFKKYPNASREQILKFKEHMRKKFKLDQYPETPYGIDPPEPPEPEN